MMGRPLTTLESVRAVIGGPEVAPLDEPTPSVDPIKDESQRRVVMALGLQSDPDSPTQVQLAQAYGERMTGKRTRRTMDRLYIGPPREEQRSVVFQDYGRTQPRMGFGTFQIAGRTPRRK